MTTEEKMARETHTTKSRRPRHLADTTDPLARLAIRRPSPHGGYGWIRDLPDERDFVYAAPLIRFPQGLPPSVDPRSECPSVYDQGQLGSCTGNGIAGAIEFDQRKQGIPRHDPSWAAKSRGAITGSLVARKCWLRRNRRCERLSGHPSMSMVVTDLATNANFVDEHEDQRLREKVNH
jgi:hypothetical protein